MQAGATQDSELALHLADGAEYVRADKSGLNDHAVRAAHLIFLGDWHELFHETPSARGAHVVG